MVPQFARYDTFAFDIETTGLNPFDSRILLMQIGFPEKEYIVPVHSVDIGPILSFLSSPKWTKIIQNAKFEQKFLQYYYNTPLRGVFDTMLAEQIINSQKYPTGLKALAHKYAGINLDKDAQRTFIEMKPMEMFSSEQLSYAAKDVEVLFPIYTAQKQALQSENMLKVAEIEFALAEVVAAMELEGIPIDKAMWQNKIEHYSELHEKSRLKMHEYFFDGTNVDEQMGLFIRDAINLNSPKQLLIAFARMGISLENTDERSLSLLDHPAAKELLKYREYQKILSAYGKSFLEKIHPFTNRIHPDFHQIGTETGRFSCREPNVQQIPEEFRKCVSLSDYKVVGADYANMELRIIAELSNDTSLIEAFNLGDDPHKSTAAAMFNIRLEDVTKEQRFQAKTINFALAYGAGRLRLMDMLNFNKSKKDYLSIQKVTSLVNQYKSTYSRAVQWFYEAGDKAYRLGYSETMLGRKRYFNRPSGTDAESFGQQVAAIKRQGGNAPIQGTNADITKSAMVNLHNDLDQYGFRAKIIIQVHDEIVVLAHKSNAEGVKQVVEESMLRSAQEILKTVPVKIDTYVSDVWKK